MKSTSTTDLVRPICAPITDPLQALCLAEVVFNSYIHDFSQGLLICMNHPSFERHLSGMAATFHCINDTQPEEFSTLDGDGLSLATMELPEQATLEIANVIISSPECATMLLQSANEIWRSRCWQEEDFTYDCLVYLGIAPSYEFYEAPGISNWMSTEGLEDDTV